LKVKRIVRFSIVLWTFFLIAFFYTSARAAIYYVDDKYGNDYNSGTLALPWQTISKANSTLKAGDTVYFRAGTYTNEQIKPSHSGTSGNYIAYQNYGSEVVLLSGHPAPIFLDGIDYVKIDGLIIDDCKVFFVIRNGSDYNLLQNNTFGNGTGAAAYFGSLVTKYAVDPNTGMRNTSSSGAVNYYNQIINNTFSDAPDKCADGPTQDCTTAPSDHLVIEGGWGTLVKGNKFGNSDHNNLTIKNLKTKYTVVRGNTFANKLRRGISILGDAAYTLLENNKFYNVGKDWQSNPVLVSRTHGADNPCNIQFWNGANHIIFRRNVAFNSPSATNAAGQYDYFYNNTFYKQIRGIWAYSNYENVINNVFKNNIFANTESIGRTGDSSLIKAIYLNASSGYAYTPNNISYNTFTGNNDYFRYHLIYDNLKDVETNWSSYSHNNNTKAPVFTDAANKDFSLTSGSTGQIDKGGWLTTISSSTGTVSQFTVLDDHYFYDGWGGIPGEKGDVIKTQNGAVTTIMSINYNTNTITVNPAIYVVEGEGLALNYSGSAPDIGAYEYGGTDRISSPKGLLIMTTQN
jgi:hypothetical protein